MGRFTGFNTVFPPGRLRPLVAAIVAAGALSPEAGRAATLTVATRSESSAVACTLRDAINSVNAQADLGACVASGAYGSNDTVAFAPPVTGTIGFVTTDPLSGSPLAPSALVIRRPIVIEGPGSAQLTLICNVAARLLEVDAGVSPVTLSGLTIAFCRTNGAGGGVLVNGPTAPTPLTVSLNDVTLRGNRASSGGGLAVSGANVGATVTLTSCSVINNLAGSGGGGGLWVSDNNPASPSQLNMVDSRLMQNSATSDGGGALAVGVAAGISFTQATISANHANNGGGIEAQDAQGVLLDSTVSGNVAAQFGGGVFVSGGLFAVTNSTLSGNQAGNAGAVDVHRGGAGALMLANSTIANNVGGSVGGIGVENTLATGQMTPAVVTIIDTLIAGNGTPDIEDSDRVAMAWDVSYSIIGDPGTVLLVGTGNQVGAVVPPPFGAGGWLGPLQDNGGPTQTHALLRNVPDPAIDEGDPAFSGLTYDQRGAPFLRVENGRVDIGAYELQVPAPPVPGPRGLVLGLLAALVGWLGWLRRPR